LLLGDTVVTTNGAPVTRQLADVVGETRAAPASRCKKS